jgi:hypothetical protein
MTTIAESRLLPEDLQMTWSRMREAFAELASGFPPTPTRIL